MRINSKLIISLAILTGSSNLFAAQLIDLKTQSPQVLQSFVGASGLREAPPSNTALKETNRFTDKAHVTHVRMQQYYRNYPIWNAHAVIHTLAQKPLNSEELPNLLRNTTVRKSMNGQLYQQLDADLATAPSMVFDAKQAERAKQFAIDTYKSARANPERMTVNNASTQLIVYVDKKHQAHWVFKVMFDVPSQAQGELPANPVYMVDAVNFNIYKHWDEVKTESAGEFVAAGGFGGNEKSGKLIYDGLQTHLSSFFVKREAGTCYMQNKEALIMNAADRKIMNFPCEKQDKEHNQLYWSGDFDHVSGSFSPANDAIFASQVIKHLYKDWYNVPALVNKDGTEMVLHMNVHVAKMDNAFWNKNEMTFGDGQELYPLTTLGIAAHEVSHGFTEQHSGLIYDGESGGMNEAFSDMAAQTAEYFVYNKSSWVIGGEIFKIDGEAMRFMDKPSKDCYGKEPGTFCSIDNANQDYEGLNVHFNSGVYNRAFYLLSTTKDWNPRKAFHVMMHANASYWLPETGFADGAACAVKAAEDLGYDKRAVEQAFKAVGIAVPDRCTN